MKRFNFKNLLVVFIIFFGSISNSFSAGGGGELLKVDWSFKGITGKFDRASLQRGYQVYNEVCASCHSMQYLSYRNLAEKGGPEFTELEAKAIASNFEVTDGPNSDGEMFERPAKLSDKFVMPYANVQEAIPCKDHVLLVDSHLLAADKARGSSSLSCQISPLHSFEYSKAIRQGPQVSQSLQATARQSLAAGRPGWLCSRSAEFVVAVG